MVSGVTVLRGRRVVGFGAAVRRVMVRLAAGLAAAVRRVVVVAFFAAAVVRRVAAGFAAVLRAVVLRAVVVLRAAVARVVLRPAAVRLAAAVRVAGLRVAVLRVAGFAALRAAVPRVAVLRATGFFAAVARFGAALRVAVVFLAAVVRFAAVVLRAPVARVPAPRVADRAVLRVPARMACAWARGRSVVVSSLLTVRTPCSCPCQGSRRPCVRALVSGNVRLRNGRSGNRFRVYPRAPASPRLRTPVDRAGDRLGAAAVSQRNYAAGLWRPTDVSDEKRPALQAPPPHRAKRRIADRSLREPRRCYLSIQHGRTSSFDARPAAGRLNKAAVNGPSFFACMCRTIRRIGRTHAVSAIPPLTSACQQKATDSTCVPRKNSRRMQTSRHEHKKAAATNLVAAAFAELGASVARVSDAVPRARTARPRGRHSSRSGG